MGEMADMCLESAGSEWEEINCRDDGPSYGPSRDYHNNKEYLPINYSYLNKANVVHKTDKAILFEDEQGRFWCPKRLLKHIDNQYYVFNKFNQEYLND